MPRQRSWQSPFQRAPIVVCQAIQVTTAGAFADDYDDALKFLRSGKYAECVEAATRGVAAPAAARNGWLLKIRAELELGKYPESLNSLAEGLKQRPTDIELRWAGREVMRYADQPDKVELLDNEFAQLVEQAPGRYSDPASRLAIARFVLNQGADPKRVLDVLVVDVRKRHPDFIPAWIVSGELALEKNDFALAAEMFEQALKLDDGDPEIQFGLAQAYAPGDAPRAEKALRAALELNPRHIRSLLFLADSAIDSERYDEAEASLALVEAVNPRHPLAAAYRAVLAHLRNRPEQEEQYRLTALKFWRANPEVDHLIGKKLSQKYRFAEGAEHQRQALAFDARFGPAKIQLAQDLLRLGKEEEGWKLADEAFTADAYNVVAHNLVELQRHLEKFRSLEDDGIVARMDAREAEVYGARVLALLKRARRELCAKYEVAIDQPVIVEMFPRQEDFAIRTFGLPGGAGFLGVCFGTVITANSPASKTARTSCWEATLWHEFCHVVTLNKTRNKMPRWLSEGISVYEERQADPAWGQAINPTYRKMLLGDELVPVSRLSGAFLSPKTPLHLQFAYYESSLVVEYLVATHGPAALNAILTDLGKGLSINDALSRHAGSLAELDAKFADFARARAAAMAPEADWAEPELPLQANRSQIEAWVKEHPHNYPGLKRLTVQLVSAKEWEAAKPLLEEMQRLYPGDRGSESHYLLLARVYRESEENAKERAVLESFAALSPDNVDVFSRLVELAVQAEDWNMAGKFAHRWLAVAPLQPEPHRQAARAAEALGDHSLAISSYRALLALDPLDAATVHLQLATSLQRSGDLSAARRHALLALEETPRFRPAQKRLLEIVREIEKHEAEDSTVDQKPPVPAADPNRQPRSDAKPDEDLP